MKLVLSILGGIVIVFGVLFLLGSGGAQGQLTWIPVGAILIIAGLGMIWFGTRKPKPETPVNVTYQVDLSGDVNLETMKCKSCGGTLTPENVKMVAGAPVVTCPFCGTTYQLTEEPKW